MFEDLHTRGAKLVTVVTGVLMLGGCAGLQGSAGAPEAGPVAPAKLDCALSSGAAAVAASAKSNSAAPSVTSAVESVIEHVVQDREQVALISTDGTPRVLEEASVSTQGKNDTAVADEEDDWRSGLENGITSSRALATESDPLGALDVAAGPCAPKVTKVPRPRRQRPPDRGSAALPRAGHAPGLWCRAGVVPEVHAPAP